MGHGLTCTSDYLCGSCETLHTLHTENKMLKEFLAEFLATIEQQDKETAPKHEAVYNPHLRPM